MIKELGALYAKITSTESQILAIVKQHEARMSIADLAREHSISTTSIYQ